MKNALLVLIFVKWVVCDLALVTKNAQGGAADGDLLSPDAQPVCDLALVQKSVNVLLTTQGDVSDGHSPTSDGQPVGACHELQPPKDWPYNTCEKQVSYSDKCQERRSNLKNSVTTDGYCTDTCGINCYRDLGAGICELGGCQQEDLCEAQSTGIQVDAERFCQAACSEDSRCFGYTYIWFGAKRTADGPYVSGICEKYTQANLTSQRHGMDSGSQHCYKKLPSSSW